MSDTIVIPQSLDQQDEVVALGQLIGSMMHANDVTCEAADFALIAAGLAVIVGCPEQVAVFVAIDASIWSQHMLNAIETAVKEIS